MPNPLSRRRAQLDPVEQRKAQEEARRQIALAVSIAQKKAVEETQAEVLQAIQQIAGQ